MLNLLSFRRISKQLWKQPDWASSSQFQDFLHNPINTFYFFRNRIVSSPEIFYFGRMLGLIVSQNATMLIWTQLWQSHEKTFQIFFEKKWASTIHCIEYKKKSNQNCIASGCVMNVGPEQAYSPLREVTLFCHTTIIALRLVTFCKSVYYRKCIIFFGVVFCELVLVLLECSIFFIF